MTADSTKRGFLAGAGALAVTAGLGLAPARAAGFTGTVTIVHINDLHANIAGTEAQIGYARIGAFFDRMRAANPDTLVLDAGDVIAGGPYAAIDRGLGFIPMLNALGLDAMTAGNAEFSYGSEHLRRFGQGLTFPLLVDNMVYRGTGKPFARGFTLVRLPNGLTAGIIGVTTPASAIMGAEDLEYTDGIAAARRLVSEAKAAGADFIVGLLHLGEMDKQINTRMVAEQVPGIDVIIDGHSHTAHPAGLVHNGLLIAQAGQFGENVGVVDLAFADGRPIGATARLHDRAFFADAPEKPEIRALLDDFLHRADAFFLEEVGAATVVLDGRRDIVRTQETALGNLFADAIRQRAGTDLALLPAGVIGGLAEPGPLNRRSVTAMARIDTPIIVTELTGAQVLAYVNSAANMFPKPSGGLLHISGGSYRIDPAGGEAAVHGFTVAGAPLAAERVYSVAAIVGSRESPGAREGRILARPGTTLEILEAHVRAHSPLAPRIEDRFGPAAKPE